jgi:putative colanic acid biosynthesis acetyltransferase WcaB
MVKELIKTCSLDYARNLDYARDAGNYKSLIVVLLFRITTFMYKLARKYPLLWIIVMPFLVMYRVLVEWVLCIEFPFGCTVGPGLIIEHGQSLVVGKFVEMGSNCRLRQSTTIGCIITREGKPSKFPRLGNNVDVGAHVVIVGDIQIGDNVIIGAGAVVVKDIPSNSVVVGNPARVIRKLQ